MQLMLISIALKCTKAHASLQDINDWHEHLFSQNLYYLGHTHLYAIFAALAHPFPLNRTQSGIKGLNEFQLKRVEQTSFLTSESVTLPY